MCILKEGTSYMQKHLAVVKGRKERRVYRCSVHSVFGIFPYIYDKNEHIEETFLWDGELNLPLLQIGDTLLIEELNLEVKINRRLLSTTGAYIYETDHVEVIEDEITKKSMVQAELDHEKYLKIKEDRLEKITSTKKKNRTWFEKWFGN